MSDNNIAIEVKEVYKDFSLPHQRKNSIKSLFTGIFKENESSTEVQHALKDISFNVKKGEFFGIVGRNGSGKSTLLKLLAEIYQPTKGNISVNGKLVPFIELGVGFNPELSGRENVYLNGALLGFSRKQIDAQYEDIVEFAELERFMDQKLKNYSSGMQVRLAFSMATRADADILLVDEVLAVGDADFQRKCFDYFKTLKKNKKTVVFVSHDMSSVRQYCDRVVMIEQSELVSQGSAAKVATEYTKLFSVDDPGAKSDKKTNRWGNKKFHINNVESQPVSLTKDESEMTISVKIQANETMRNPIIGFLIKNATTGVEILGTNTKLELVNTGKWESGVVREIHWTLPNIFTDNKYQIDIAVLEDDGVTVADWWEDATQFRSFEEIPSTYIIKPAITTILR